MSEDGTMVKRIEVPLEYILRPLEVELARQRGTIDQKNLRCKPPAEWDVRPTLKFKHSTKDIIIDLIKLANRDYKDYWHLKFFSPTISHMIYGLNYSHTAKIVFTNKQFEKKE